MTVHQVALVGTATGSPLLLVIVVLVLLFGAQALVTSIGAVWALIADLLRVLFASIRALAVIGLLIACIVMIVLAGGAPDAGGAVGSAPFP